MKEWPAEVSGLFGGVDSMEDGSTSALTVE